MSNIDYNEMSNTSFFEPLQIFPTHFTNVWVFKVHNNKK